MCLVLVDPNSEEQLQDSGINSGSVLSILLFYSGGGWPMIKSLKNTLSKMCVPFYTDISPLRGEIPKGTV